MLFGRKQPFIFLVKPTISLGKITFSRHYRLWQRLTKRLFDAELSSGHKLKECQSFTTSCLATLEKLVECVSVLAKLVIASQTSQLLLFQLTLLIIMSETMETSIPPNCVCVSLSQFSFIVIFSSCLLLFASRPFTNL